MSISLTVIHLSNWLKCPVPSNFVEMDRGHHSLIWMHKFINTIRQKSFWKGHSCSPLLPAIHWYLHGICFFIFFPRGIVSYPVGLVEEAAIWNSFQLKMVSWTSSASFFPNSGFLWLYDHDALHINPVQDWKGLIDIWVFSLFFCSIWSFLYQKWSHFDREMKLV